MKTAMQDMIQKVECIAGVFSKDDNTNYKIIHDILYSAYKLLEKEKEQIMNAYSDGAKGGANGTKGQHESGWVSIQTKEKYYNQTYNK